MKNQSTFPVPYHKGRPSNVIGAHCVCSFEGKKLLGTIIAIDYEEYPRGGYFADVKHFDGTNWPIRPNLGSIMLLDRTFQG